MFFGGSIFYHLERWGRGVNLNEISLALSHNKETYVMIANVNIIFMSSFNKRIHLHDDGQSLLIFIAINNLYNVAMV